MKDLPKRTKKDEDDYNAQLRREEPIKTEIIVALKQQVRTLLENQQRTLDALLRAESALHIYRMEVYERTGQRLQHSDNSTIIGLPQFYWDNVDGWHRKDEGTK